jgi:cytochrome c-type biogenesis protein CcmF
MQYLAQLYLPGALALWCAVLFALATLWGYARLLTHDTPEDRLFARRSYDFFTLSIFLASAVLALLLLRRDFRIEYVYQYTGLELPWHFQLSAFWAGQKGSFLVWLLVGALLGLALYRTSGREEAPVMGVYTLSLMGLLFILVRENPFVMLPETPLDGAGLNPLLQDNWMVIHPPVMFVGYAAAAIPFCFAVAALWRGRYDRWAHLAFPWALFGFLVLGTAILMGGYWAYKTLGWGGYWGWDPVENASLIPWLLGTVLIHGLHMERRKGRYRRVNLVVAWLMFLSVLYGTFLTRSGVLADFSVHSFVDLGISGWLVTIMAFFGLGGAWLLATRLRGVPSEQGEDPLLSRGTFMALATITVAVCALVVAVGTSAPLLTRFMENPGQVGPAFYNQVNFPVAVLLAFLLAVVPYLTWRGTPGREVARRLVAGAVVAVALTGLAAYLGVYDSFHLLFVFLATLALLTNLQKAVLKWRAGGARAAGGYLSHVGVGVMLLGFLASSAYDESIKVTLEQGQPRQVGNLTLTFNRFIPRQGFEKERMEVEVVRGNGRSYLAYPKLFMNDRTRQVMANPHIRSFALQDLYISPIEFDPGEAVPGQRVQLAKGEAAQVGELTVRFLGFDLEAGGHGSGAALGSSGPIAVGAALEVQRNGSIEEVRPLYRFTMAGQVEAPAKPLPGGGTVLVSGINAATGAVQLDLVGLTPQAEATPAKLAVDLTRKPLINLVWFGLYIVLGGGILATAQRLRESFLLERRAEEGPSAGA